jgi:hypothetical protein
MNEINGVRLPTPTGLKSVQPQMENKMESTIGKAIALLNQGTRLPYSMIKELREDGIDIPSFHEYHLKK